MPHMAKINFQHPNSDVGQRSDVGRVQNTTIPTQLRRRSHFGSWQRSCRPLLRSRNLTPLSLRENRQLRLPPAFCRLDAGSVGGEFHLTVRRSEFTTRFRIRVLPRLHCGSTKLRDLTNGRVAKMEPAELFQTIPRQILGPACCSKTDQPLRVKTCIDCQFPNACLP